MHVYQRVNNPLRRAECNIFVIVFSTTYSKNHDLLFSSTYRHSFPEAPADAFNFALWLNFGRVALCHKHRPWSSPLLALIHRQEPESPPTLRPSRRMAVMGYRQLPL